MGLQIGAAYLLIQPEEAQAADRKKLLRNRSIMSGNGFLTRCISLLIREGY